MGRRTRFPDTCSRAPGPTDLVGLLVDHDVVEATVGQPGGARDPGHPGADDPDAERTRHGLRHPVVERTDRSMS